MKLSTEQYVFLIGQKEIQVQILIGQVEQLKKELNELKDPPVQTSEESKDK